MVAHRPALSPRDDAGKLIAVLGPTNTGKTHLAIERLCGHSSGAIGFPLRLLAREVYERVCAIKGAHQVALITGEERIEPRDARWLLCTAEAMPTRADLAFMALDEAQLCADRERGHIFTDRLLHARGREETMILGSATIEPLVRSLLPRAEIVSRPRFSTLRHDGARKLSRVPPRSAIVAFSAEQVYAVAELLRRFRGGAAVVMGALSPETRNKQVAMFQSGEVDYLVATDAIGMGLNLDLDHVAFAGLSKFDGQRQRRLTTAEMAQIAGRAGRHHRDGTFGTLSGTRSHDAEFTPEEVYAIEEHRFPPLTRLFWREADPRIDSLHHLIEDLSAPPERPELAPAPEAIDLAVMRRLAEDPEVAGSVRGRALVERFRETCMLPDFRQQGAEVHSRFVARLWQDLRHGALPGDYVAARIAELDIVSGDIDTLQGRIAAIRSWSYIAQRPDWMIAREEMAARARAVEARLSDALHSRLTERFVNRRLTILMRGAGADAALLPVALKGEEILVDGEPIGKLEGFQFKVDPQARHADHKLLFAAAERHLPQLLAERAQELAAALESGAESLYVAEGKVMRGGEALARIEVNRSRPLSAKIVLEKALEAIPEADRRLLKDRIDGWMAAWLKPLDGLAAIDAASREESAGPDLRALMIKLVDNGGVIARWHSGFDALSREQRNVLRSLGVYFGTLEIYVYAMLKPAAQQRWRELCAARGWTLPEVPEGMPSVIAANGERLPSAYRRAGKQAIRVDLAERLFRAAHSLRVNAQRKPFVIDEAMGRSMGLTEASFESLMRGGGFRPRNARKLAEGEFGPPEPKNWKWIPPKAEDSPPPARPRPEREQGKRSATKPGQPRPERKPSIPGPATGSAFAGLADLWQQAKKGS
ncbi:helicase-related protein [Novosphingobium sp. TH158]|uniref:helicase-related protein n=1 Tax=Novosphingobium sp. TH158 TaxID=2067455 RepID=UPI000C7D451F|nr:helicase-related protein [Novosphingobium sp. TH158]PLK27196.1 helicase [Novosphingobium sp. TH158]